MNSESGRLCPAVWRLLFLLPCVACWCSCSARKGGGASGGEAAEQAALTQVAALITNKAGTVQFREADGGGWLEAEVGMTLHSGSIVRSDWLSQLDLVFTDNASTLTIDERSLVYLEQLAATGAQRARDLWLKLYVPYGHLWGTLLSEQETARLQIRGPHGAGLSVAAEPGGGVDFDYHLSLFAPLPDAWSWWPADLYNAASGETFISPVVIGQTPFIPEPGSVVLLGVGGAVFGLLHLRRARRVERAGR